MKILKKIFGYGIGKEHFFKKTAGYNLDKYIFKGNIQKTQEELKDIYLEKISLIKKFLS